MRATLFMVFSFARGPGWTGLMPAGAAGCNLSGKEAQVPPPATDRRTIRGQMRLSRLNVHDAVAVAGIQGNSVVRPPWTWHLRSMSRTIREQMQVDLVTALKAGDVHAVSVLRTTLAALDNAEAVDPGSGAPLVRAGLFGDVERRPLVERYLAA